VTSDGAVNASGSPVSIDHFATGVYLVNFGVDITHCTALANQGAVPAFSSPGHNTGAANGYGARVDITSGGASYAPGFSSANSVAVETFSGSTLNDTSFEVAVFC
jgi:hypothetical protein